MYKIEIEFKKGMPLVDVELIRRVIGMFVNVAFVGIIEIRPTSLALDGSAEPACNCTFNYGSHMPNCAVTEWQSRQ